MTVGSLFSGIGGLDLAFEWAGFSPAWQVERDPFCRAVLAKHWPDVERFADVCAVGAANLSPVECIIGGFPCQDVSDAGTRAGIDGDRSGLWREFARVVREVRPRVVVVENVAGLLVRGLGRVLGDLAALGYDAEWCCLRAADVGAPHRRLRVFIVAYTDGIGRGRGGQSEFAWLERASGAEPDGCRDGRTGAADMADAAIAGPQGIGSADTAWRREPAALRADRRTRPLADAEYWRRNARIGYDGESGRVAVADWCGAWPARPGEPQHAWEPPRVLRRAESGMGVVPDGPSAGLVRHRRRALAALGNAVVPQQAYPVACRARAILEADR